MATFKNRKTGQVSTETWLEATGVNTNNGELLQELGWLPIIYDYQEYDTLREEMLPNGNPVLNKDKTAYVQKFKIVALSEDTLAENLKRYKEAKLESLNEKWLETESNGTLDSSLGFTINANDRANRDVQGLITAMQATGLEKAEFCAADNSFHEVSLEDLKVMQLEIILYGQNLYSQKWGKRTAIEKAESFEEVDAVNLDFA